MNLNDLQVKVVNNFLNLLVLEIADNYLNQLKNFKPKEVDEILLKFLDNSVFLAVETIDITNIKLSSDIKKITTKEQEQFKKAFAKKTSYSNMCIMLNFIYSVIKEKDKQEQLFNNLYQWYEEKEDILIKENIDIYKEIKPWLLTKIIWPIITKQPEYNKTESSLIQFYSKG